MKWEYLVIGTQDIRADCQRIFSNYGKDRWKLVSVDNSTAYFKRPKIERKKREYLYVYDTQDGYIIYKGDEKIEPWNVVKLLNEGKVE
jgi:hypothetical protein